MNFLQFIISFTFTKNGKRILNFQEFVIQSDCFDKKTSTKQTKRSLIFILKTCNLFVTSKNETTKPRIHQFTNLEMSFKAFQMKKQGLKCFLK